MAFARNSATATDRPLVHALKARTAILAGSFRRCRETVGDLDLLVESANGRAAVARLIAAGKLAGFHFNDSKYGDDDLDSGSVDPFRLFLVFNELVDAEMRQVEGFSPAYMIDQSHNVTDPIESLMASAVEIERAQSGKCEAGIHHSTVRRAPSGRAARSCRFLLPQNML